ncbi:MAG: hypothetical protein IPJ37_22350 [Bacteroidales bacterium]|nr:hypothetical protein [Bacteroidales bacterium]
MIKLRFLKSIHLLLFLMLTIRAAAPDVKVAFIVVSPPIEVYARLIRAVIMVESYGDTMAYNLNEEAIGAFQIRPIRLLDYNQRTGNKFKIEDCYNYRLSKEIFLYYAKRANSTDYELIARNWNGSGETTLDYWKKVKAHL